jgi:hypothetical protein
MDLKTAYSIYGQAGVRKMRIFVNIVKEAPFICIPYMVKHKTKSFLHLSSIVSIAKSDDKKTICNYICHTFCRIRKKHISCLMMRQGNLWWFKTFAVMHMLEPELCTMTQVTRRKKRSFHTSQFKDTRKIIYIYKSTEFKSHLHIWMTSFGDHLI